VACSTVNFTFLLLLVIIIIIIIILYIDYATGSTIRGSNTGMGKIIIYPPKRPDRLWGPPNVLLAFEWSFTYASPTCLHGIHREDVMFD
jgi:hypothetical protein